MDRISAWIDEKPYRFQLILLGHTAVFACAILIAAGLFRNPAATPRDYAESTLDARGLAQQPAASRTTRTETAGTDRSGGRSVATQNLFRDWGPIVMGYPARPSRRRNAAFASSRLVARFTQSEG